MSEASQTEATNTTPAAATTEPASAPASTAAIPGPDELLAAAKKDVAANRVYVSRSDHYLRHARRRFTVGPVNWIAGERCRPAPRRSSASIAARPRAPQSRRIHDRLQGRQVSRGTSLHSRPEMDAGQAQLRRTNKSVLLQKAARANR